MAENNAVTKEELREIMAEMRQEFRQELFESRAETVARFEDSEKKTASRFDEFEKKTAARFDATDEKIDKMYHELLKLMQNLTEKMQAQTEMTRAQSAMILAQNQKIDDQYRYFQQDHSHLLTGMDAVMKEHETIRHDHLSLGAIPSAEEMVQRAADSTISDESHIALLKSYTALIERQTAENRQTWQSLIERADQMLAKFAERSKEWAEWSARRQALAKEQVTFPPKTRQHSRRPTSRRTK